jgi:hypothetical protein
VRAAAAAASAGRTGGCDGIVAGSAMLAFALGAIWVPAMPVVAAPADIRLVCDGIATAEGEQSTSASPDEVLIDITGDSGRIKLPERLAPYVHFRPEGWRRFSTIAPFRPFPTTQF